MAERYSCSANAFTSSVNSLTIDKVNCSIHLRLFSNAHIITLIKMAQLDRSKASVHAKKHAEMAA